VLENSAFNAMVQFLLRGESNPRPSEMARWKSECEAYMNNALSRSTMMSTTSRLHVEPYFMNYALENGRGEFFKRPDGRRRGPGHPSLVCLY